MDWTGLCYRINEGNDINEEIDLEKKLLYFKTLSSLRGHKDNVSVSIQKEGLDINQKNSKWKCCIAYSIKPWLHTNC